MASNPDATTKPPSVLQDRRIEELTTILDRELRQWGDQSELVARLRSDVTSWRNEALEQARQGAALTLQLRLAEREIATIRDIIGWQQDENSRLYMFIRVLFRNDPLLQERYEDVLDQITAGVDPTLFANEVIDLTEDE